MTIAEGPRVPNAGLLPVRTPLIRTREHRTSIPLALRENARSLGDARSAPGEVSSTGNPGGLERKGLRPKSVVHVRLKALGAFDRPVEADIHRIVQDAQNLNAILGDVTQYRKKWLAGGLAGQ